MIVPVFKRLSKPMTWGGVPRNIFILIILASCKYDPKIFTILYKNLNLKTHYFEG